MRRPWPTGEAVMPKTNKCTKDTKFLNDLLDGDLITVRIGEHFHIKGLMNWGIHKKCSSSPW
jgi:hypothetical protein